MVDYDVAILGAGPGGYVAAIRAAQLGLKPVVIEKDKLGGVCLNIGCIPSKALIHLAEIYSESRELEEVGVRIDREALDYSKVFQKSRKAADTLSRGVQFLLKKNNVEVVSGTGSITGKNELTIDGKRKIRAKNILVATGSRPRSVPGFEYDGENVISSNEALMLQSLPKSVIILGAGAIGVEFAYVFSSFGSEVHLVEMMDQVLPIEDGEAVEVLVKSFEKSGVNIYTSTRAISKQVTDKGVTVTLELPDGTRKEISAEKLLVAVGRAPNTEDIGLDAVGIETERGFIPVGDYYQTSVPGIFAIGDVVNTPLLAHVASREGEIAVEFMAGHKPVPSRVDPTLVPSAVYSEPQVGSFGWTEKKLKAEGKEYRRSIFPYRGAGKSVAVGKPDGIVKVLSDPKTNEILGAHICGADATELIHELLLARSAELLPEDIADMIHAHPTLSESVLESARGLFDRPIHA